MGAAGSSTGAGGVGRRPGSVVRCTSVGLGPSGRLASQGGWLNALLRSDEGLAMRAERLLWLGVRPHGRSEMVAQSVNEHAGLLVGPLGLALAASSDLG